MADYKGLNITFRADTTPATKALNILGNELKSAQGSLTGFDSALKNLATNGKELNNSLNQLKLEKLGEVMKVSEERAKAYADVLPEVQNRLSTLQSNLENAKARLEAMGDKWEQVAAIGEQFGSRVATAMQQLVTAQDTYAASWDAYSQKMEAVASVGEQFGSRVSASMQGVVSAQEALASCTEGTQEFADAQARLDDAIEANVAALAQEAAAIERVAQPNFAESFDAATQSTRELNEATEAVSGALSQETDALNDTFTAFGTAEGKVNALEERVRNASDELERTTANMATSESAAKAAAAAYENFGTALAASQTNLGKFGEDAKKAGESLTSIGDAISSVGDKMSILSAAALMTFGRSMLSSTEEFGNAIAQMGGYLDISGAQLDEMREKALYWGKETQFSATEAADAMNQLAKGGMTQVQITGGAMAATMDLAAAGELNMATAAETTVQAMNVFRLGAEDATQIADALAGAANKSTAEVSDLAQGFSQIGGAAEMAGWNINEVTGAMALLADRGFSGAEAGTTLKVMLQKLANPTKKAQEVMADLGVAVYDSQGKMVEAREVVQRFEEALEGLTDEQRNQALLDIFGQRGINGMAALVSEGTEAFSEYIAATEEAGYASEMAKSRMDDLGWALEFMRGEVETAVVNFGTALAPTIIEIAEAIENLTAWFNGLSDGQQEFIAKTALMVTAAGPVLSIVGHLTSGIGGFVEAVGTGVSALANWVTAMKSSEDGTASFSNALANALVPSINDAGKHAEMVAEKTESLNLAFSNLQKGLAGLGIAALIGMITSNLLDYIEAEKKAEEATKGLHDAITSIGSEWQGSVDGIVNATRGYEEIRKASRELNDEQAKLGQSISESMDEAGKNTALLEHYAEVIESLTGQSRLTAAEQEKLKTAVDEFNSIAGTSISVIDAQTGQISTQVDVLYQAVDAFKDYAQAQAAMSAYVSVQEQIIENEIELARLKDELASADKGVGWYIGDFAVFSDFGGVAERYHELEKSMGQAKDRAEELKFAQDYLNGVLDDSSDAAKKYQDVVNKLGPASKNTAGDSSDLANSLGGVTRSANDAEDAVTNLKRAWEDLQTARKRELDDAQTDLKRSLDDELTAQKDANSRAETELSRHLDAMYDMRKAELDAEYTAAKEAYDDEYSALKTSLDRNYDLRKSALSAEYDAAKAAYSAQYDALKSHLDKEYSALKSSLDKRYNELKSQLDKQYSLAKSEYDKQYSEYKKSLDKQIQAQKDANSKTYDNLKSQLASEVAAMRSANTEKVNELKKVHKAEESALKKALDAQYKVRQKELNAEYKQAQKANQKILKDAKSTYSKQTKAFKDETSKRVSAIKDEYARMKQAIADTDGTKAIDSEIQALKDATTAEQAEIKKRQQAEKKAELEKAVQQAKTRRTRQDAEAALADYLAELAQEQREAEREAQIKALEDRKDVIAEETKAKQEALDDQRDAEIEMYQSLRDEELEQIQATQDAEYEKLQEALDAQLELRKEANDSALESYRESLDAQLAALQEKHQREQDALSDSLAAQVEAVEAANAQRLESLKAEQDAEIEAQKETNEQLLASMKERQASELEDIKEQNSQRLEAEKESNSSILAAKKDANSQILADAKAANDQALAQLKQQQEDELTAIKDANQRILDQKKRDNEHALTDLKNAQSSELDAIKQGNDDILQELKDRHAREVEATKRGHEDILTAAKRGAEDELTAMKRAGEDAVENLKRAMGNGVSAVKTGSSDLKSNLETFKENATDVLRQAAEGVKDACEKMGLHAKTGGEKIRDNMSSTLEETRAGVEEAFRRITRHAEEGGGGASRSFGEAIKDMPDKARSTADSSGRTLSEVLRSYQGEVGSAVSTLTTEAKNRADELKDRLAEAGGSGGSAFGSAIGERGEEARQGAQTLVDFVMSALGNIDSFTAGWNVGVGLANGMSAVDIYTAAWNIGCTALDAILHSLGIASPSKEAAKAGRWFTKGLIVGMEDETDGLEDAADNLADAMLGGFDAKGMPSLEGIGTDLMDGIISEMASRETALATQARRMADIVRDEFSTFGYSASVGLDVRPVTNAVRAGVTEALRGGVPRQGGVTIVVNEMNVRDETDVRRVGESLYQLIAQGERRGL